MSEEKKWKVYCYTNKVNGKKYIGITSTSLAARSGKNGKKYAECTFFGFAIKKYGWEAFSGEILEDHLCEQEAAKKEEFYINSYQTRDPAYGYNIRPGGYTRHEFSEDGKRRFIESHSGKNAHHARRTAVYDLTGKLVSVFDTSSEAAKYVGVSDVSETCKTKRGTAGGFIVRYEDDFPGIKQLPDQEVYKKYDYRLLCRPINQYSLDGRYIKTFPSTLNAAKEVGLSENSKSVICSCLKGHLRTAYGFMWRYSNESNTDNIPPLKEYKPKSGSDLPQSVRIQQLSLNGELLAEYSSIREAHIKTGASTTNIHRHLVGEVSHPLKYIWRYAE